MGIDFADLTIVQCTKEQVEATFNHHHPHWGVPRGFTNIKDYYARERGLHNESQPWYTGGRFTTWALVPRANPTTIDLLASCETCVNGYSEDRRADQTGTSARRWSFVQGRRSPPTPYRTASPRSSASCSTAATRTRVTC
jgi:hypothetical protein